MMARAMSSAAKKTNNLVRSRVEGSAIEFRLSELGFTATAAPSARVSLGSLKKGLKFRLRARGSQARQYARHKWRCPLGRRRIPQGLRGSGEMRGVENYKQWLDNVQARKGIGRPPLPRS